MTCRPVLNLKASAEKFESRMKVKMIIERIMIALLKSKIIYSSELIYTHGLVSRTEETRTPSFSWTCQIFDFEKMLLFS